MASIYYPASMAERSQVAYVVREWHQGGDVIQVLVVSIEEYVDYYDGMSEGRVQIEYRSFMKWHGVS